MAERPPAATPPQRQQAAPSLTTLFLAKAATSTAMSINRTAMDAALSDVSAGDALPRNDNDNDPTCLIDTAWSGPLGCFQRDIQIMATLA